MSFGVGTTKSDTGMLNIVCHVDQGFRLNYLGKRSKMIIIGSLLPLIK